MLIHGHQAIADTVQDQSQPGFVTFPRQTVHGFHALQSRHLFQNRLGLTPASPVLRVVQRGIDLDIAAGRVDPHFHSGDADSVFAQYPRDVGYDANAIGEGEAEFGWR